MKKIFLRNTFISLLVLTPIVTFAALEGLRGLIKELSNLLVDVWSIVIGLAFIYFFWGVGQFILHSGDQKARDEGKQKMIWGIIALFVIVSVGGILLFVGDLIGIYPDSSQFYPN